MVPPVLVPNIKDQDKLAYHISIMFYIIAGVATLLFILVIIGKFISRLLGGEEAGRCYWLPWGLENMAVACGGHSQQPEARPLLVFNAPNTVPAGLVCACCQWLRKGLAVIKQFANMTSPE